MRVRLKRITYRSISIRCLTEREQHAITKPLTFGFQLKSIIIIISVYTRTLSVISSELWFEKRSKTFNLNSLMRTRAEPRTYGHLQR